MPMAHYNTWPEVIYSDGGGGCQRVVLYPRQMSIHHGKGVLNIGNKWSSVMVRMSHILAKGKLYPRQMFIQLGEDVLNICKNNLNRVK